MVVVIHQSLMVVVTHQSLMVVVTYQSLMVVVTHQSLMVVVTQLFAVSPKVHTTQNRMLGGFVEDNRQVVSYLHRVDHVMSCDSIGTARHSWYG